jgi:hypothetical protein
MIDALPSTSGARCSVGFYDTLKLRLQSIRANADVGWLVGSSAAKITTASLAASIWSPFQDPYVPSLYLLTKPTEQSEHLYRKYADIGGSLITTDDGPRSRFVHFRFAPDGAALGAGPFRMTGDRLVISDAPGNDPITGDDVISRMEF